MFNKSNKDYSKVLELKSYPNVLYLAHLSRSFAFNNL